MQNERGDFGPVFVTADRVQAWLSLFARKAKPADASDEVSAPQPAMQSVSSATLPPPLKRPARGSASRPLIGAYSILATLVLVLGIWAASGFYKVLPDQVGLVLRFGRWIDTRGPGLNYHWPYPVESVLLPKVTAVNQLKVGNGLVTQMLTGDENIVEATASVSWRIKDPVKFLFNVFDPEGTVKIAGESAVRQIIGLNPIQSGLSDQRQKIADDAQALLQKLLDFYDAGIEITQVQLQRVDPPVAVIDAFNDVQRARADQQRARNEAEAYRNDILPRARGEADRLTQEAQAYKEQVLDQAHSEADRFTAYDTAYRLSPEVSARRLYLQTMDEVLKSAGKILIDSSGRAGPSIVPYLSLGGPPMTPPAATKVVP